MYGWMYVRTNITGGIPASAGSSCGLLGCSGPSVTTNKKDG